MNPDDLQDLLAGSDSITEIIYLAAYNAFKDAIAEAELEDALSEGSRIAMAEQLEWLQTKFAWLPREN